MSFKREGEDKSQLNILKKRRVADLLSHFIPEDEAALLKNGRYTCLVCSYRPVFDTVDTLTVHRTGRRHLEGLKSFYGKKARLKNEITKRQHEDYVQAEDQRQEPSSSAPLLTQTRKLTHHALLKTAPYSSRHRTTSSECKERLQGHSSQPDKKASDQKEQRWTTQRSNCAPQGGSGSTAAGEEPHGPGERRSSQAAVKAEGPPLTAEGRSQLEHYLRLKSNGWIQDGSGQWVKDQNVEFDSDEEQPPPLPPLPQTH